MTGSGKYHRKTLRNGKKKDMTRFLEALHSGQIILMDGAMGTELRRSGLGETDCGELWNLTHPERVRAIHRAYVAAGAQCLLTNSFQANPATLARHGLAHQLEAVNAAAVELARSAIGDNGYVLGDIGPLENLADMGRVVRSLPGADALLLETWSELAALRALGQAGNPAWNPEGLPVLVSFTYRQNPGKPPSLPESQSPEEVAALVQEFGAAGLGVNCGRDIAMEEIVDIVRRYRAVTDLPLFARPNAGTPIRHGDRWVHPHTPEQMAACLPDLLAAGLTMLGGCCGTTPAHIAAFRRMGEPMYGRIRPPI